MNGIVLADERISFPRSWKDPANHLQRLLLSPWYKRLYEVNNAIQVGTRNFFELRGVGNLHVPVTTTSISSPMGLGSDSEPVRAEIAGGAVYLADSLQFLLELGCRIAGRPVYYVSSAFRGEDVDSTHLSEFCHAETEIEGSLDDIVALAGAYVSHLASELISRVPNTVADLAGTLSHLESVVSLNGQFERIRFDDALRTLEGESNVKKEVAPGVFALTREGEQKLMSRVGAPLWVTHMPALACPFYQRPESGTSACLSADLLLGPGEILGAGERCADAESTLKSLRLHDVDPHTYQWYVEMKRIAPLQTSGFGLGVERFIMWALKADDIRDCTMWLRQHGVVMDP
ncbi:UNVERIFIED_ORG: aspartyl/asparaginyl-tRNA synthetase [Burkholderia contaminans]|nr:aspartyl/asparaginyl-tRNA synthetase [Burkholderia contaminans]